MKILHVVNSFKDAWSTGGPARSVYELSLALVKRGHKVTVFTTDKGLIDTSKFKKNQALNLDGIETYYFRNLSDTLAKKGISIPYYASLMIRRKIKDLDILHIHEARRIINIPIYYYARKFRVPYVFHARGSLPRIMGKQRLKLLYDVFFGFRILKNASKVIAVTNIEAKQYLALGVPKEKIVILPNGIDLSLFRVLPQKGSFKKKFNVDNDTRIILYLGRIHKIKGVDTLVKAFVNVAKSLNKVILVIAGPDYGFLDEVKALIDTLRIGDRVLITGPLYGADKFEAYVDATIVVVPSRYEIFGNVVLESYACYKPVVASRVAGLQEIVFHDETGLLFKKDDVNDLYSSIMRLLTDEKSVLRMGLDARQLVEKNFNIEEIVKKLESTYFEVLRDKGQ